jgi:hypothetical protein
MINMKYKKTLLLLIPAIMFLLHIEGLIFFFITLTTIALITLVIIHIVKLATTDDSSAIDINTKSTEMLKFTENFCTSKELIIITFGTALISMLAGFMGTGILWVITAILIIIPRYLFN